MGIVGRPVAIVATLCAAVGCAWLTVHGFFTPLFVVIAVGVLAAARPNVVGAHRGILLGLLVLGAENGLPFVDTARHYLFGYAIANYMVLALIVLLAIRIPRAQRRPGLAALSIVTSLFVAWWLITLWHSGGEPLSAAASFGRDFLVFALLATLFPMGLAGRRESIEMVATVCAGALAYSVGEIAITVTHHPFAWLVHPVAIRISDVGLRRVYAFMSDSSVLLFCLALGAALLGSTRRLRRTGGLIAVISGAAIILQQTRAFYVTVPVALILVLTWWIMFAPTGATWLARRVIAMTFTAATFVGILAIVAPSVLTTYAGLPFSRLGGALTQLSTNTGNLSYRFHTAHNLLALLNGSALKWSIGLGFLDPKYHHFVGLPLGTIRNSDLGVVDGIMLVGLVGIALTYLVVLIPLRELFVETRSQQLDRDRAWLVFGMMVWFVQVLLASYNLSTLWEQAGQVLTAMVVGVALHAVSSRAPMRRYAPAYQLPVRQAARDPI